MDVIKGTIVAFEPPSSIVKLPNYQHAIVFLKCQLEKYLNSILSPICFPKWSAVMFNTSTDSWLLKEELTQNVNAESDCCIFLYFSGKYTALKLQEISRAIEQEPDH